MAVRAEAAERSADRRPAGATHDRIVDAAERCIRRWGIRRISMNDVGREAGVSRGSVYRYFADRDALVQAVLERSSERQIQTAEPMVRRRRTLAAKVAEAAVFIRSHIDDELSLGLRVHPDEAELATLRLARAEQTLDRWIAFWVPYLEDARERGEVRADLEVRPAAEWIMRILVSLVTIPSVTVDLDDPAQVRRYVERHIVRGFGSEGKGVG
ncbi:MAG TPA: helix-turn-helix domain-containing protein [Acidimicrobiia bacterium]